MVKTDPNTPVAKVNVTGKRKRTDENSTDDTPRHTFSTSGATLRNGNGSNVNHPGKLDNMFQEPKRRVTGNDPSMNTQTPKAPPPAHGEGSEEARHHYENGDHFKFTEAMHRDFIEAIYDLGVKHASPSIILENMTLTSGALTSERVKSHLQKYRNNRKKSKADFLEEYDSWMQKALTVGGAAGGNLTGHLAPPSVIMDMVGSEKALGGDLAAYLSYSVLHQEGEATTKRPATENGSQHVVVRAEEPGAIAQAHVHSQVSVPFPILTEEERQTPLGVAFSRVINLFRPMMLCIRNERLQAEKESPASDAADNSKNSSI